MQLDHQLLTRLQQSPAARKQLGDQLLGALLAVARTSDYNTAYPNSQLGRSQAMDALARLNLALQEAFNVVPGVDVPDPKTGRHKFEDHGNFDCSVCGEMEDANPSHNLAPKMVYDEATARQRMAELLRTRPDDAEPDMFGGFAPDEEERERRAGMAEYIPLTVEDVRMIRDSLNKQARMFSPASEKYVALWHRLRIFAGRE